jgi:hypothetical protein
MNTHASTAATATPGVTAARAWVLVTRLLLLAVFTQAVTAGSLLSGQAWARSLHGIVGPALVPASLLAGILAALTLRRTTAGRRLAVALVVLALVLFAQNVLGDLSASGTNLLWIHVPLGVALVGLAIRPTIIAGGLREERGEKRSRLTRPAR